MGAIPLHFLPILGATVAKIVLGALWYSPALFVRPWAEDDWHHSSTDASEDGQSTGGGHRR